jgi:hypothetical protein
VRVEVPALFATEIVPSEQVGAGLVEGEMLQVRATAEGLSPPTALLIAIVDCADFPGATESDAGVAERLKSGAATTRLITVEVLRLKFPFPPYAAVMLWVPAVRAEVEKVATPLPLRAELPSCVVPSRNATMPDGTPPPPGVTVAVNMTV